MAGGSAHALSRRRVRPARTAGRSRLPAADARPGVGASAAPVLNLMRANGWLVLHDRVWPGRAGSLIDHVVAGPAGVFVVSEHHWSGAISVDEGALRCRGALRVVAVGDAVEAAAAVSSLVPGVPVTPVLCFPRPEPVDGSTRGVLLSSTENVLDVLLDEPGRLDAEDLRAVTRALASSLRPADRTLRRTAELARAEDPQPAPPGARRLAPERHHRVRWLVAALLVAAVALAGVTVGPRVRDWVDGLRGQEHVTAAIGTPVVTARTPFHPPLRITADRPTPTTARAGRVPAGTHVIAVRITVHNEGSGPWRLHGWTSVRLVDVQALAHAPDRGIGRVAAGPLMSSSLRLRPGATASGYFAFTLPTRVKIGQVRVALAPSGDLITWTVG
ncbi:nuclease-related domain-containing protein [Nocardioides terrisoli]|uniref:nuclease-related domain-containing protein n=1 Tax=Nocardioides terrisoli TaxID=3388267 RepID=UPI00287B7EBA|nr:nuclease-related domain-containing protein [Nocardioides marmorisolisilvae]